MTYKTSSQSRITNQTARTSQTLASGVGGPTVSSIIVTDNNFNNLDDTAAPPSNSFIKVIGTGYQTTANVFLNGTMVPKANINFVNSTELRITLPVSNVGNYTLSLFNSNSSGCLYSNNFVVSTMPQWLTNSSLTPSSRNVSVAFSATSDSTITYSNVTNLPTGTTLLANGYFYGYASINSDTTFTFELSATDQEYQNTNKTFTLPVVFANSGQQLFTTTTQSLGDYSYFTVPAGVTAISAVVVGGGGGGCRSVSAGGGGSGGDLRWIKSIDVTPGEILRIDVGAGGQAAAGTGGDGYFSGIQRSNGFVILQASGGGGGTTASARPQYGGSYGPSTTTSGTGAVGPIGGGNGGTGGAGSGSANAGGGGGAGGYLGDGGNGAASVSFTNGSNAVSGSGGGGGGGAAGSSGTGGTGGGVDVNGWGADGSGGVYNATTGGHGGGGSGGQGGGAGRSPTNAPLYGSGGGGDDTGSTAHNGAQGAVRLIWPAQIRYYPYTRTNDE